MIELSIENLTKVYCSGQQKHMVFHGLSFDINKGEFVSILGPSGCGKTSLLNIIGGFIKPTAGRIIAGGKTVTGPGTDRTFVFQNYALFPWMTVKDNILYPMKLQKIPLAEREARLRKLLSLAKLDGKENMFPQQLSGGMKQRTGVVRALACQPGLLLMDEPLGAVDMQMRRRLQIDLEDIFLTDPATVLMVTHDIEEAVFLSDRIILMSPEGAIVNDLTVELPRPRNRRDKRYKKLVGTLEEMLNIEQGDVKSPEEELLGISR